MSDQALSRVVVLIVEPPDRRRRDGEHELIVGEEECGCVRLHCTWGHPPEEILAGLDQGLTLDDLLCDEHRQSGRASS